MWLNGKYFAISIINTIAALMYHPRLLTFMTHPRLLHLWCNFYSLNLEALMLANKFVRSKWSTVVGIVVVAVGRCRGCRLCSGWLCGGWLCSCSCCCSARRSGRSPRALTAWDQVLDPGKETLDSSVDPWCRGGTTPPVTHHTHQRVFACGLTLWF